MKTVIITGAAKRVGKEIANWFMANNWNVAVHYNNTIPSDAGDAFCIKADLRDEDATRNIITQAKEHFGRVDCLINNASVFEKDNITTLTDENLTNHLKVNMIAPLILSQEFATLCEDGSHIINLSDGSEGWSMSEKFLSYTLSKMGLENQSALLAKALAPKTQVHCLKLGTVLARNEKDIATFEKIHNSDSINSITELLEKISDIL